MTTPKSDIQICKCYVDGMHCAACEIVVEKSLSKHQAVKKVQASLNTQTVTLHIEGTDLKTIHLELNNLLKDTGYSLSIDTPERKNINYVELGRAFSFALLFLIAFVLLQKLGIVSLVSGDQITLPFVFFIGVVASLSTCMAVVGGLVLSLSSSYAKSDVRNSITPLIQFHVSRILSFFLLGGLIGLIGSTFTLTLASTLIINIILFAVMLILGINLLDVFPVFRKFQLKMPKILSKKALDESNKNIAAPIILGASTFFLPCGFTQSMQIYSITTGNFITGALVMLTFALGTLPMLSLISIASVKLAKSLQSSLFFKTAGFIVLFFAIFNFLGALAAIGLIKPIFSF